MSELENISYFKEIVTFTSGVTLALIGLFTKRMLKNKDTKDLERLSADETARSYLAAPLEEFKGPILEEYRSQIAHLNQNLDGYADSSITLSRMSGDISKALGQLEAIIENAQIAKLEYDSGKFEYTIVNLKFILDKSFRSAARLKLVKESLESAENHYTTLLEESEAEEDE